jgi:hypothetical protein
MLETCAASAAAFLPINSANSGMRYYDLKKHWTKKIQPHLADKELNDILVRDMNKLSSLWGEPFVHGMFPWEFDQSDWVWERRGRPPRFWKYIQLGSCHWLVNFNLKLATLVEPQARWRIVTSDEHSTVWDGEQTVLDFNSLAVGIPAQECFDLAFKNGRVLRPGKFMRTYRYYCPRPVVECLGPSRMASSGRSFPQLNTAPPPSVQG